MTGTRAFGPVPSRRLGRSLGINNIPAKTCTYACVYCQVGRTTSMRAERRAFYDPEQLVGQVGEKVEKAARAGEPVDYLTFVPDGEPTLDIHLGREIDLLKPLGIPVAVISNASLMWREDVREDLAKADWVSLKMDAAVSETWRRINRPHRALRLAAIAEGQLEFAQAYQGELVTETMLVQGINDSDELLAEVAGHLARLSPSKAYLSIPIRPPAETWVHAPSAQTIHRAYRILADSVPAVEYLVDPEGDAFAFTGAVEEDLLGITAVHPMREDALRAFLARAGADWRLVEELIADQQLLELSHQGHRFYVRRPKRSLAAKGIAQRRTMHEEDI
jgi:wyosine [tRNA(Phe)-imidazoG37] synthetase (radical SAM superfamily)